MRWGDFRRSENVEDRTGQSPSGGGFPIGGLPIGGGALVIVVIVGMLFGINPLDMLGMLSGGLVERDADVLAHFDAGIAPQWQLLVIAERGGPHAGEVHLLAKRWARAGERQCGNEETCSGPSHSTLRWRANIHRRDGCCLQRHPRSTRSASRP